MKKIKYLLCVFALVLLVGCSKGYKEGEYTGTAVDSYGGQENTASAVFGLHCHSVFWCTNRLLRQSASGHRPEALLLQV